MKNEINQKIINYLEQNTILTTALPYANGDLHLGHYFEAVIADIIHKNTPNSILISGEDQHGAAITLYSKKIEISEIEHISNQLESHKKQYKALTIDFDYFGQTHSELHKQVTQYLFTHLFNKKIIIEKPTLSWFDQLNNQYLPDRYVRGICPHCKADNQYPEICENCGKRFKNEDLINPISVLSNQQPILKETIHYFLNTKNYYEQLTIILEKDNFICKEAKNKLLDNSLENTEWLDISRDKPYFGIEVPKNPQQCFYVWFDAPIAYLTFTLEHIKEKIKKENNIDLTFEELIQFLPYINFKHIIGKDIIYFHTYYWLNLLKELNLSKVNQIITHGWLTQDGVKFSKTNGNKNDLTELSKQEIDALRFYLFSIYENSITDFDISLLKIKENYNQILIGKYININSRITKIIETKLEGYLNDDIKLFKHKEVYSKLIEKNEEIKKLIENLDFRKSFLLYIELLNDINFFIQNEKPWTLNAVEDNELINEICFISRELFLNINIWLKTICPNLGDIIIKNNNIKTKINHQNLINKID